MQFHSSHRSPSSFIARAGSALRGPGPEVLAHPRGYFLYDSFVLPCYIVLSTLCGKISTSVKMPSVEVDVQKLKELRRHKVLSMRELEDLSGVSYNTIWRLETGRTTEARPRSIRALARALGVEPHELLKEGESDA
jgi:DNA-binding Xre family transcriptional regulator